MENHQAEYRVVERESPGVMEGRGRRQEECWTRGPFVFKDYALATRLQGLARDGWHTMLSCLACHSATN